MELLDQEMLEQWNLHLAAITTSEDPEELPGLLMAALCVLVETDFRNIFIFGPKRKPISLCESGSDTWPADDTDYYLGGAYLLDPYYRAGINKVEAGLYQIMDIAPTGFQDSEYFKNYYKDSPIEVELGFITYLGNDCFANLAFNRQNDTQPFSEAETNRLRAALPLVESLLTRYWNTGGSDTDQSGSQLYVQLEQALSVFGTSVLTPREAEVMRMYLYGHDTRSISERLSISTHTVSAHRKHAYARLDITSQAELFSLFINSMYCFDGNPETDALDTYLNTPSSSN